MNELVDLIVKKTGIPAATATQILEIVMNYAGKKLPAPFGAQLVALLSNDQAVQTAENVIGDIFNAVETAEKTKKKKK